MNHSSIIYDYLRRLKQDPGSKVFAPLAEAYRKSGMLKEAVEVATEGLRYHPDFLGGRVALGRALFDLQKYREVIVTLESAAKDAPENIAAQKLLADSFLMLKEVAQALLHYKILLYYHPTDVSLSKLVQELESSGYKQGWLSLSEDKTLEPPDLTQTFEIRTASQALSEAPEATRADWSYRVELLQKMLQRVERYRYSQID